MQAYHKNSAQIKAVGYGKEIAKTMQYSYIISTLLDNYN